MTRVIHDQFDAMGSTVELVVVADDIELVDRARQFIAHLEQRWSRFLPDSDISRINLADGATVRVHRDTVSLLEAMRSGAVATGGTFDPTLLAVLVEQGYGRSRVDEARDTPIPPRPRARVDMSEIRIDADGTVQAPAGTCLDPGGIGKGLAADLVAADVMRHGARGVLVSVGGDLRVTGEPPQEGGWAVDVVHPHHDGVTAQLRLVEGGVATSGTGRRRWTTADGSTRHHLLDHTTGRPVDDDMPTSVVEVTVVAGSAAWAEVWTKDVFARGAADGLGRLEARGLPARAMLASGVAVTNAPWDAVAVTPAELERFAALTGTGGGV